jgi:hypothetical protein
MLYIVATLYCMQMTTFHESSKNEKLEYFYKKKKKVLEILVLKICHFFDDFPKNIRLNLDVRILFWQPMLDLIKHEPNMFGEPGSSSITPIQDS